MKNFKKIFASLLVSCMLILPFAATVSAEGILTDITDIIQYFGYDLTQEGIAKMINDIQNGGIGGIVELIGGGDIMDALQDYMNAFESELTTRPQETTTAEETTTQAEEPVTEAPTQPPVVYPSYQYTPPATSAPTTTLPPETTTFEYIPPEQIYTEAFTTTVFNPIVQENDPAKTEESSPLKTTLGVLLLLGSGVGVIVVVVALKKNKI